MSRPSAPVPSFFLIGSVTATWNPCWAGPSSRSTYAARRVWHCYCRSECGGEVSHPLSQGKRKKVLKALWREQPSLLTGSRSYYPASPTEPKQWMIVAKKLALWYQMQAAFFLSYLRLQSHMRRSMVEPLAACWTDPPENKVPQHLSMISSV
jgi:hypothetical protein